VGSPSPVLDPVLNAPVQAVGAVQQPGEGGMGDVTIPPGAAAPVVAAAAVPAAPTVAMAGGGVDKVNMILSVVGLLIIIGMVVVVALIKVE